MLSTTTLKSEPLFKRLDPYGNPNVGVYVRVTSSHLLLPPGLTENNVSDLSEAFKLDPIELTVGGSTLIGSLVAGNEHGWVVADMASNAEVALLKEKTGLPVYRLESARLNAAGNNILCNDLGALCHPDLSKKAMAGIAKTLKVEVANTDIGGVPTVGTAGVALNKGVLVHPLATDTERRFISDRLHAPAAIGTVNHGHGLVGAGMAANAAGAACGSRTTGIELGRIEEALGFLE